MKSVLLVLAVLCSLLTPALAQKDAKPRPGVPGEWQFLGQRSAKYQAEHDEIEIKGPFNNFRRIAFTVTEAPLRLYKIAITYDSGAADVLNVREEIPARGSSRAIELRGIGQRRVKKIEFWYETIGKGRGKADVCVYGMK